MGVGYFESGHVYRLAASKRKFYITYNSGYSAGFYFLDVALHRRTTEVMNTNELGSLAEEIPEAEKVYL